MKCLISIILLLGSFLANAEVDCKENGSLSELIAITGQKCFSDEVTPQDIPELSKEEILALCKNCRSEVINTHLSSPEGSKEKKVLYGDATLNEFQKELTLISLDLMKMRSSFKFDLDAKKIIGSCSFNEKNLRKPSCLKDKDLAGFNKKVLDLQNKVATEISNILSEKPEPNAGLLVRRSRNPECEFQEKDILFSKSRFNETLMTPELIKELKKQNLNGKITVTALEKDDVWEKKLKSLKGHPLFNVLLNDPVKLSLFVNEIGPEDNNAQIIEKLYKSKQTQAFGESVKLRCEQSFKTTSEYLEKIYCNDSSDYVADDLVTIEAVAGTKFISMNDKEAEKNLQTVCSHMNTKKSNAVSFDKIQKLINGANNQNLVRMPITEFRSLAFDQVFNQDKISLCKAMAQNPPCTKDDLSIACQQLHFLKQAKESQEYKTLANSSNDDINNILRSLMGDGVPQKDGKPDAEAIALLKSEGILPGGDTTSRPQQQSAADFHKAVSSASAIAQPQQATKPAKVATPTKSEEVQPTYTQSAARNSEAVEEDDDSSPSNSDSPAKQKSRTKSNSKFSNLSDDEQQRIMDMMKRSKKAGGKTPKTVAQDDEESEQDSAFNATGAGMAGIGAQAASPGSEIAQATQRAATSPAPSGKKAVLDPTKKTSSLNDAMIDANTNRQPASSGPGSSNAQVSISKSAANENEIKIKVTDAELSQVNEFKEKLKVLLNAHSQEISVVGAGEKFLVKLNNFEINVVFNKQLGTYEAICKDASIPKDYLKTISTYFNVILKGSSGKREALINTLKQ